MSSGNYLFFLTVFFLIPFILFLYWAIKKTTSLWTGAFFLYSSASLFFLLMVWLEKISKNLTFVIVAITALGLLLLGTLGIYAMIIALFWNERILLKFERPSFSNFLPLIVATILLVLAVGNIIMVIFFSDTWLIKVFSFVINLAIYLSAVFFFYSVTSIIYNVIPIRGKVDYIIVLGAGLNKDKVTPLLAARIDAGAKLYLAQQEKKNHSPTIILSGGQGADELISEAEAMNNYLKDTYPKITQVLLEKRSTNTEENLRFSELVATEKDAATDFSKQNIVIATSNYHLLRAGKLAKKQGLNAQGVGAKTRLFYLPAAFIREYIGYLVFSKTKHLTAMGFIFLLTIGLDLIMHFLLKI
ncbi:YdcF family protein [Vagococcus elongatus]|nr:YdcF family protein [Vagococcus elongatus]